MNPPDPSGICCCWWLFWHHNRDWVNTANTVQAYFTLPMAFLASTNINTVKRPDGGLVTGQSWRLSHPFIMMLPFYSGLASCNVIGKPLEKALTDCSGSLLGNMLLVVRKCVAFSSSYLIISCLIEICRRSWSRSPFQRYNRRARFVERYGGHFLWGCIDFGKKPCQSGLGFHLEVCNAGPLCQSSWCCRDFYWFTLPQNWISTQRHWSCCWCEHLAPKLSNFTNSTVRS